MYLIILYVLLKNLLVYSIVSQPSSQFFSKSTHPFHHSSLYFPYYSERTNLHHKASIESISRWLMVISASFSSLTSSKKHILLNVNLLLWIKSVWNYQIDFSLFITVDLRYEQPPFRTQFNILAYLAEITVTMVTTFFIPFNCFAIVGELFQ